MAEKDNNNRYNGEAEIPADVKIRAYRRLKLRRRIMIFLILAVFVTLIVLLFALASYDSYNVKKSIERGDSSASRFLNYQNGLLEYSNDGAVYMDLDGNLLWNQAFEMNMPSVEKAGDYLLIYDRSGTDLYIMTASGQEKYLQMARPIRKACIAEPGTVAVLLKEEGDAYVRLYDKSGTELAGGEFFVDKGYLPIDIALSADSKKLAIDMVDINSGGVDTVISFYNFGSVGKNEVDNKVSEYMYENTLIPEIDYLSANAMLAVADDKFILFEGSEKPSPTREIHMDREVESVFHNNNYIGVVYPNGDLENTRHVQIYDMKGKKIASNETSISYNEIYFMENDEVCILGDYDCEILTTHSIRKFVGHFDDRIYKVLSSKGLNNYILVRNGATEEIHLQ